MEDTTEKKVKVRVGVWDLDGKFTGEVLRFSGTMVSLYREYTGKTESSYDRGIDYMLYRTPEGSYRVHVESWNDGEDEGFYSLLLPNSIQSSPYDDPRPHDLEQDEPIKYDTIQYDTYTEAEAR